MTERLLSELSEEELFAELEESLKVRERALDFASSLPYLCTRYSRLRLLLLAALPFVELLPRYGKTVATAVRSLMEICDRVCQVT